MSDVLKNRLETIVEAVDLIGQRMLSIQSAEDFVETDQGYSLWMVSLCVCKSLVRR